MVNAWSLLYDEIYGDGKMTDKKEENDSSEDLFTESFDYLMDKSDVSGAGAGTGDYPYDQNF